MTYADKQLIIAAERRDFDSIKKAIDNGANVNATNNNGWSAFLQKSETALHSVAYHGNLRCLRLLLEAGAHVDVADTALLQTPLHYAASRGHLECTRALIDSNANINARDEHGASALHRGAEEGRTECLRALIEAGADINATDQWGWSALHWATSNDHFGSVLALLQQSEIDPHLKTTRHWRDIDPGASALDIAQKNGHYAIAQALQEVISSQSLQMERGTQKRQRHLL